MGPKTRSPRLPQMRLRSVQLKPFSSSPATEKTTRRVIADPDRQIFAACVVSGMRWFIGAAPGRRKSFPRANPGGRGELRGSARRIGRGAEGTDGRLSRGQETTVARAGSGHNAGDARALPQVAKVRDSGPNCLASP